MKLHKIVSGGQTGADLTALEYARELGLETGGWCPSGCQTEAGPNLDLVKVYGLVCTPGWNYQSRTRLNVRDSDVTLWFGHESPGKWCTYNACLKYAKDFIDNPSDDDADAYCAIYWFANDWHGGMASNLYLALCATGYRPGCLERGPEGYASEHYDALVAAFKRST